MPPQICIINCFCQSVLWKIIEGETFCLEKFWFLCLTKLSKILGLTSKVLIKHGRDIDTNWVGHYLIKNMIKGGVLISREYNRGIKCWKVFYEKQILLQNKIIQKFNTFFLQSLILCPFLQWVLLFIRNLRVIILTSKRFFTCVLSAFAIQKSTHSTRF